MPESHEYSNELVLKPILNLVKDVRPSIGPNLAGVSILENISKMLALPLEREIKEVRQLMAQLSHDPAAYSLLMSLLERGASRRVIKPTEKELDAPVSMLVAIPVLFAENDYIKPLANSSDDMKPIEQALANIGAIDEEASFTLIPRIFEIQELHQLSYGAVFKITDALQKSNARVDPTLFEPHESAPGQFLRGLSPNLTVRYLIGLVSSVSSRASHIFPFEQFDEEKLNIFIHESVNDGVLCSYINKAFNCMAGCVEVGVPDEFFESIRQSSTLVRDVGLELFLERVAQVPSLELKAIFVDNESTSRGGALLLARSLGDSSFSLVFPWERLANESRSICATTLVDFLNARGFEASPLSVEELGENPVDAIPYRAQLEILLGESRLLATNLRFTPIAYH